MTMVDYRGPPYQLPRRPLPAQHLSTGNPKLQQIVPDSQWSDSPTSTLQSGPGPRSSSISHSNQHNRRRTSSSSVFPVLTVSAPQHAATSYQNSVNPYNTTRRTLSNATTSTSTTATSGGMTVGRPSATLSVSIRRAASSRSGGGSAGGYVAIMRRQKATVWCDRSQLEDPRLLAQQKAAKLRAAMEVIGNGPSVTGRASSTNSAAAGSARKIRHHHAKNNPNFSPATLVGVGGVPMRLSASEVGDEGDSDEEVDNRSSYHKRTGSGRSSIGSNHRRPVGHVVNPAPSMTSRNSLGKGGTPPSGGSSSPNMAELETPLPGKPGRRGDYFSNANGGSSGNSSRENSFGNVGSLAPKPARNPLAREKSVKSPDELRRRGSVDDRAMTMSAGRLFIANPDIND
ncbi:hypothetical protein GP486_003266 [Trichoglossum hirsutum]|uniref:Uncharacterized protein n=1 Tax=Trichoglossum hirsutum TaxID=265104 RepID=A0A9P8LDE0_9PEZI|nr:hypothetical protein GP486_003266 [Trichoglossum hirsutum]